MSGNNDSNAGFWVIMVALGGLVLYFWKEVLTFILGLMRGLVNLAGNLVADVIGVALLIGVLYLISQIFKSKKK